MEKVIMEKMRKPFVIRSGDVWCALFALVLGSVQGLMEPILVFLFLTHGSLTHIKFHKFTMAL